MDKAKAAVKNFVSKSGHDDTTVDERMNPAVTEETIHKKKHEETTAAIDREVHQDHYHTTVQPVKDQEVLPEQHQHRVIPVEHREHHHNKDRELQDSLEREQAGFRNTRTEGTTTETASAAPTVAGEHTHHHIHEVVQPVIQKDTIQPSTVHTTVPIHETVHKDPQHHSASALPAVSLDQFNAQGGVLEGREARHAEFKGGHNTTPSAVASERLSGAPDTSRTGATGAQGGSGIGLAQGEPKTHIGTGATGGIGNPNSATYDTTATTGEYQKPSLKDKLNPKVDADGDGKAGVFN